MNKKYKVVIADKMDNSAAIILEKMGIDVDSRPSNGEIPLEDVIKDADALLVRSATTASEKLIDKATKLKAIGRAGIGVDNIDINKASDRGIAVINTPVANAVSTAEHTIALIFSIARLIPQANQSTHAGKWEKTLFKGREVTSKNLGIIGCGNIGKIVADRAKGLHMNVLASDPALTDKDAKELGINKVSFDELIEKSDFITLHTPLIKETNNILNAKVFERMKESAYVINAGRGGVVNEEELKNALDNDLIAGAALDVFVNEPVINHPLLNHPKVIMTPHIAASTDEAQANVAIQIAEQIGDYLLNNKADHILNSSILLDKAG